MKHILIVILLFVSVSAFGQDTIKIKKIDSTLYVVDNSIIYETVAIEEPTDFPGGAIEFMKFIKENIVYPDSAKQNNIEGKAYIKFVVEKDGSASNFEVLVIKNTNGNEKFKQYRKLLTDEAIRVLKKMPKWESAKQGGKPVRMYYTVPINFKIN